MNSKNPFYISIAAAAFIAPFVLPVHAWARDYIIDSDQSNAVTIDDSSIDRVIFKDKETINISNYSGTSYRYDNKHTLLIAQDVKNIGMNGHVYIFEGSIIDFIGGDTEEEREKNLTSFTHLSMSTFQARYPSGSAFSALAVKLGASPLKGESDYIEVRNVINGYFDIQVDERTLTAGLNADTLRQAYKDGGKTQAIYKTKNLGSTNSSATIKFLRADGTILDTDTITHSGDIVGTNYEDNLRYVLSTTRSAANSLEGTLTSTVDLSHDGVAGANATFMGGYGGVGKAGGDAHLFGNGGRGGDGAPSSPLRSIANIGEGEFDNDISALFSGLTGGNGGTGGKADGIDHPWAVANGLKSGDGGNGGKGGDISLSALYRNTTHTNKTITLNIDSIRAGATAGAAGLGGKAGDTTPVTTPSGAGIGTITKGQDGQKGAPGKAEAYGIRIEGANDDWITINTTRDLTITATAKKATNDEAHADNRAYAIHATALNLNLGGSLTAITKKDSRVGDGVWLKDSIITFLDNNKHF